MVDYFSSAGSWLGRKVKKKLEDRERRNHYNLNDQKVSLNWGKEKVLISAC